MNIDSGVITTTTINPCEGNLLCTQSYNRWASCADVRVDTCDSSYPPNYDVGSGGFHYPGLVYDGSYPRWYNISGGMSASSGISVGQWSNVITNDIENQIDTSTEPSYLKNTKTNIRKIKPDINSKLKRI